MKDSSHKRHLVKSITWRLVGSVDTMALGWLISGNPFLGLQIGLADILSKIALYYLHERFWYNLNLDRWPVLHDSRKRHLIKSLSWRILGTIITIILAGSITGSAEMGMKIGIAELFTKMALYYFHERLWHRSGFGLNEGEKPE